MNGEAQSITVSTLPRSVFYAYTFLISTIVQLDPVGRHPKCLHFAAAGLERLTEMLDFGRDMASPEAYEGEHHGIVGWSATPRLTKIAPRLQIRRRPYREHRRQCQAAGRYQTRSHAHSRRFVAYEIKLAGGACS